MVATAFLMAQAQMGITIVPGSGGPSRDGCFPINFTYKKTLNLLNESWAMCQKLVTARG